MTSTATVSELQDLLRRAVQAEDFDRAASLLLSFRDCMHRIVISSAPVAERQRLCRDGLELLEWAHRMVVSSRARYSSEYCKLNSASYPSAGRQRSGSREWDA